MSLLSDGAALRASLRSAAAGQAVLYRRGSSLTAAITARVGAIVREIVSGEAVLLTHGTDFIFAVADAVWSDGVTTFTPQPGDKITYGGKVYEVAAMGGTQCYEPSDSHGVSWRVHTQEVYD